MNCAQFLRLRFLTPVKYRGQIAQVREIRSRGILISYRDANGKEHRRTVDRDYLEIA